MAVDRNHFLHLGMVSLCYLLLFPGARFTVRKHFVFLFLKILRLFGKRMYNRKCPKSDSKEYVFFSVLCFFEQYKLSLGLVAFWYSDIGFSSGFVAFWCSDIVLP